MFQIKKPQVEEKDHLHVMESRKTSFSLVSIGKLMKDINICEGYSFCTKNILRQLQVYHTAFIWYQMEEQPISEFRSN